MNGTTGKSPAKDNGEKVAGAEEPSTHPVKIHKSETGADVDPGRTPGKAEGIERPEMDGNQ